MKKVYKKPVIIFESFALSTSIAGTCDKKTNSHAVRQCGVDMGGDILFLDDMTSICDFLVSDEKSPDINDGYCYDVPYEGQELFNS